MIIVNFIKKVFKFFQKDDPRVAKIKKIRKAADFHSLTDEQKKLLADFSAKFFPQLEGNGQGQFAALKIMRKKNFNTTCQEWVTEVNKNEILDLNPPSQPQTEVTESGLKYFLVGLLGIFLVVVGYFVYGEMYLTNTSRPTPVAVTDSLSTQPAVTNDTTVSPPSLPATGSFEEKFKKIQEEQKAARDTFEKKFETIKKEQSEARKRLEEKLKNFK